MAVSFVCVIILALTALSKSQYVDIWYDNMQHLAFWESVNSNYVSVVDGDYWLNYAQWCYDCYYDNPCPRDYGQDEFCVDLYFSNNAGGGVYRVTDITDYDRIRLQFDVGGWGIGSTSNFCQVYYAYDAMDNDKTLIYQVTKQASDPFELNNRVLDLSYSPQSTLVWIFLEAFDGGAPSSGAHCYFDDVYLKGTSTSTKHPTVSPTKHPSTSPTKHPSALPSNHPTKQPLVRPTNDPSVSPTDPPTIYPSENPSVLPTVNPVDVTVDYNGAHVAIETTPVLLEESDEKKSKRKKDMTLITALFIGALCTIVIGCCACVYLLYFCFLKEREKKQQELADNVSISKPGSSEAAAKPEVFKDVRVLPELPPLEPGAQQNVNRVLDPPPAPMLNVLDIVADGNITRCDSDEEDGDKMAAKRNANETTYAKGEKVRALTARISALMAQQETVEGV